jgi:hypothetical protein
MAGDPVEPDRGGGRSALATLFGPRRERLRRILELRLDRRPPARLEASDFVPDSFFDLAFQHNHRR